MFNVQNLNDEFFINLDTNEVLEVKKMTTDDKVKCFKYFLNSDVITNISVISNIYLLINGISDIEEEALDDERIFFNSLEEYVDIKLEIKNDIDKYNIRLLQYYLGVIEGLSVVLDELKIHIPNTYFNIMPLINTNLISKIMLKYLDRIDCSKVKPVFNATQIYGEINNTDSLFLGFVQSLMSEVSNNDFYTTRTV